MVKIGNEAKLILKLAKEKMDREKEKLHARQASDPMSSKFIAGTITGIEEYEATLSNIICDMER